MTRQSNEDGSALKKTAGLRVRRYGPTDGPGLDAAQPNLVFVMADDCTYRDIGCYGGQAHIPSMDALAKQGLRLNRCYR